MEQRMALGYQQEQASLIAEEKEAKRLEMLQRLRKQSQLENEVSLFTCCPTFPLTITEKTNTHCNCNCIVASGSLKVAKETV